VKSRLVENAYSSTDFFPGIGEDGTWLFFTGALLRDAEGKIWGALETLEDITEQKMSVEGLRLANQKLNLLSDITRHDILNSLTVLVGSIDLIREESSDPALTSYIDQAEKALDSIRRQITFTRDYQNLGVTAPIWQDLSQVIQDSIISQVPPGIILSGPDTGIEIFADTLLGRVFSNLLDNSLRHGEKVTEIGISVSIKGDSAKICYSDNGKGIPDALKERIFEQGVGAHTGFGLFLIREILSISQITIRETGRAGEGVVFEMTIPSRFFRYQS
ncbi:MAG: ATP-binding protein, partial [Methanospirillum sp.]|nr:ATP-binding protein [Methanospirillum sp.]